MLCSMHCDSVTSLFSFSKQINSRHHFPSWMKWNRIKIATPWTMNWISKFTAAVNYEIDGFMFQFSLFHSCVFELCVMCLKNTWMTSISSWTKQTDQDKSLFLSYFAHSAQLFTIKRKGIVYCSLFTVHVHCMPFHLLLLVSIVNSQCFFSILIESFTNAGNRREKRKINGSGVGIGIWLLRNVVLWKFSQIKIYTT